MSIDTTGSYGMKSARLHTRGFTLIASLLMLLLLSGIAIGLMMMVNTEGRVGGTDLQNNMAFHAAEGGIEKMYSDLATVFQNTQAPSASEICGVGATANQPAMGGVTWTQYSATPQGLTCPASALATVTSHWGPILSGPNTGLYAQIIPVNMLATASLMGGQEVSMTRQAQVALIPVFQFGVFCDADCSIFPGSPMTFAGAVHANGDFYPFTNTGSSLTFQSKISAFGNIVRTVLPNTNTSAKDGKVYVPTSNSSTACSITVGNTAPSTAAANNCLALDSVTSSTYGDGSVTGMGSGTAQITNYYSAFNNWSNSTTHDEVINGNYYVTGATTPQGTGAKKLKMPFVGGGAQAYEILRRPVTGESATSALGQSREYNLAQIHVLLSDDPADLPGGASDTNNVRLANVTQTTGNATVTPWGVTIPAANYPTATFGTSAGNNYNLYFATASNAIPIPSTCQTTAGNPPTCTTPDWLYAPAAFAGESATQGLQPAGAPSLWTYGNPTIDICPPSTYAAGAVTLPAGCELSVYPYYALPISDTPVASSALTNYPSQAGSNAWNLIDGYLRVEYLNNSGAWVAVTNEWLQLGFARGVTAPTAASPNPINPNAILLLQQPADRSTNSTLATEPALSAGSWAVTQAGAPTCSSTQGSGSSKKCKTWTAGSPAVPLLLADSGVSGGQWAFGVTPAAPTTTTPQSLTQFNWYPINFYDAREGEPRDIDWSSVNGVTDNSCTTNGVMNAVEIDVGNLQNWLANSTSGKLVNSSAQNGYILYFSDRRGMLLNPNLTPPHPANTKSGDSGLEDTVNSSSTVGTPDGALETKMTGQAYSPEDDNENNALDNWGTQNLGLGFYGTTASATQNLNAKIISTNPAPNPYGTVAATGGDRINSCGTTGRKNWVSGARHVLKLVDGSLGNVPLLSVPVVYNGTNYYGGFTVASENPLYIQGDYNSNAADTVWNTPPVDKAGMAAAAVIADTVTLLSNNWDDRVSMVGTSGNTSPTNLGNRPTTSTYYRVAVAAGKNMTFKYPTAWPEAAGEDDIGTDGGIHNFLHLLENWGSGGVTENYKGSLASLYYSTYNTGFYKCCTAVYGVPNRNFSFDTDFSVPAGLPPGTPMFRDVESLSYRQLLTTRQNAQ